MRSPRRIGLLLLLSALCGQVGACSPPAEPVAEEVPSEDGKADNFYSPVGQEYDIAAEVSIQLSAEDQKLGTLELADRLDVLLAAKAEHITSALDLKLMEIWPEYRRQQGENIVITLRAGSPTHSGLLALGGGAYKFTYHAEAASNFTLLQQLPLDPGATLKLTVDEEELTLKFSPIPQTADSYPRYLELFDKGLEITIHIGGEHLIPRNDLNEARGVYDSLLSFGFRSPVARFEDLRIDSPPLNGQINVAGRWVDVNVYLFHADMAPADHLDLLLDVFKTRVKTADVVIYRGHAGPQVNWSGVVLHYDPRIYIPATDFRTLDLPQKYQLFLFDGCETYAGYADQIFAHPLKNERNADVITSVNYANLHAGESVTAFLQRLFVHRQGSWVPSSWAGMLKAMSTSRVSPFPLIYGVHGLSDNPRLSPLADPDRIGSQCESQRDCPSIDSLCVQLAQGRRVCGAACTDDSGCPAATRCRPVVLAGLTDQRQCLPTR